MSLNLFYIAENTTQLAERLTVAFVHQGHTTLGGSSVALSAEQISQAFKTIHGAIVDSVISLGLEKASHRRRPSALPKGRKSGGTSQR